MWSSFHTLPSTPSVELTYLIPCQQSLHVDMAKSLVMKKVDDGNTKERMGS
jgi:hypothetical protein